MARIVVRTERQDQSAVTLDEHVEPERLQDGAEADALVARIGWALVEADENQDA